MSMHIGLGHYYRKKSSFVSPATSHTHFLSQSFIDKSVYVVSVFGVVGNIPQLLKIWVDHKTEGVSLLSWLGFIMGSVFWLIYGLIHKEKPIVLANSLLIIVQFLIVLGLFIQSSP